MILAPIQDHKVRHLVRRAALPEEDVLHRITDVTRAMDFGHPRLVVCRAEDQRRLQWLLRLRECPPPVLAIHGPGRRDWKESSGADGIAVSPMDDAALRLRGLMEKTGAWPGWVEAVFVDLTQTVGRPLPLELRGLVRRILEFPTHYSSLRRVAGTFGLTPGALKARFRRRSLPSPSRYLRWCRLLSAAHVLSDPAETILSTSFRMGFTSDGNFCRWVTSICGLSPSALREWDGRLLALIRFSEECLSDAALDRWDGLQGLFLREVA